LTLSGGGFEDNLVMDYAFDGDDQVQLSFTGADLDDLGIDLGQFAGIIGDQPITATLERATESS
jgi:hypothetical protein